MTEVAMWRSRVLVLLLVILLPAASTAYPLYTDGIASGVEFYPWNAQFQINALPSNTGIYSIRAMYNGDGGVMFYRPSGFSSSNANALVFAISRGPLYSAPSGPLDPTDVWIDINGVNKQLVQYVPEGVIAWNTWYLVTIPLQDFISQGTTINYIAIKCGKRVDLYLDAVGIESVPDPRPKVTHVFADKLVSGWLNYSWFANVDFTATTPGMHGERVIRISSALPYAGLYLFTGAGISGINRTALQFRIRVENSYGNELWIRTNSNSRPIRDYTTGLTLLQGNWYTITIPLRDFWAENTTLYDFIIQCGLNTTTFSIESIRLVQASSSAPAPGTIYGDARASDWYNWSWGLSSYDEGNTLRFTHRDAWSGMALHKLAGIYTGSYNAVSFSFRTSTSAQDARIDLIGTNGSFLGPYTAMLLANYSESGSIPASAWVQITVPLSHFNALNAMLYGVTIQSPNAGVSSEIDDMRLTWVDGVERLRLTWPLPGGFSSAYITNNFGTDWVRWCGGLIKKHPAVDVRASKDTEVRAAASGTVKEIFLDSSGWRYAIVLDHGIYTTQYWHVEPHNLYLGKEIRMGDLIARVADLAPYRNDTHFHFGVRFARWKERVALAGSLPQTPCDNYPAFPEFFINPIDLTKINYFR